MSLIGKEITEFEAQVFHKDEFKTIKKDDYIKYKKNKYEYDILIEDKHEFKKKYDFSIIDKPNIEDIMVIYIKGEK